MQVGGDRRRQERGKGKCLSHRAGFRCSLPMEIGVKMSDFEASKKRNATTGKVTIEAQRTKRSDTQGKGVTRNCEYVTLRRYVNNI